MIPVQVGDCWEYEISCTLL